MASRSPRGATRSNATSSASAFSASPNRNSGSEIQMAQPKNFGFGSEEQMVRDSARKFLKENAGIESLRAMVARDHKTAYESDVQPAAYDQRLWAQLGELGWPAGGGGWAGGGV